MTTETTRSVTGRDGYLMRKALAYAIEAIEALPPQWQEWSDCQDMKALINDLTDNAPGLYIQSARHHLRQRRYASTNEAMEAMKADLQAVYVDEKAK